MSTLTGERGDMSFTTPARGGEDEEDADTSSESFSTPVKEGEKTPSPSKSKNNHLRQKQLEDDRRSPDPLHLARRTNSALTRKRAERERSVYAAKEPKSVIIGFLDRLVGMRELACVPVSGLAVALQDLARLRGSGHSSQALFDHQQQQQEGVPIAPESPKPSSFEPSPEMPKWSSIAFGRHSSPLVMMTTASNNHFMQQFGPSSSAKSDQSGQSDHQVDRGSSDQSQYSEALGEESAFSQRTVRYRYERMNCDLGFRFDRPVPLKSSNLFNTNASRTSCLSNIHSYPGEIPLRRVTFTSRPR